MTKFTSLPQPSVNATSLSPALSTRAVRLSALEPPTSGVSGIAAAALPEPEPVPGGGGGT